MFVVPVAGQNRRCNTSGSNLSVGFCFSEDENTYTWAITAYKRLVVSNTGITPNVFFVMARQPLALELVLLYLTYHSSYVDGMLRRTSRLRSTSCGGSMRRYLRRRRRRRSSRNFVMKSVCASTLYLRATLRRCTQSDLRGSVTSIARSQPSWSIFGLIKIHNATLPARRGPTKFVTLVTIPLVDWKAAIAQ
jgi:hypothetical protein